MVTSPIGDHAPPALAAITISEAYQMRSFWSGISLRTIVIRIIVVVRLSMIADKKNAIRPIIHSSFTLLLVRIIRLIISKPRCISITSTMVIAPIKKKRISAVSAKLCCRAASIAEALPSGVLLTGKSSPFIICITSMFDTFSIVQHITAIAKAEIVLSTLI